MLCSYSIIAYIFREEISKWFEWWNLGYGRTWLFLTCVEISVRGISCTANVLQLLMPGCRVEGIPIKLDRFMVRLHVRVLNVSIASLYSET